MKIGERLSLGGGLTGENLAFLAQLGADGVMVKIGPVGEGPGRAVVPLPGAGDRWETGPLLELKRWIEGFGLEFFGIAYPLHPHFARTLRGLPGRDQEIQRWCGLLRTRKGIASRSCGLVRISQQPGGRSPASGVDVRPGLEREAIL